MQSDVIASQDDSTPYLEFLPGCKCLATPQQPFPSLYSSIEQFTGILLRNPLRYLCPLLLAGAIGPNRLIAFLERLINQWHISQWSPWYRSSGYSFLINVI